MKVYVYINEKGGVGKSLLSVTTACWLAARGKRVLIIDTDEQGHVATSLGYEKGPGLFDLLQRNRSWKNVLQQVEAERFMAVGEGFTRGILTIVPSNIETRALPFAMRPEASLLARRLEQLETIIDYVIIDTAPAASLLHLLIYTAADYAIYPTKTEYLSFDGLVEAQSHLESANDFRMARRLPPVQIAGIIPNMFRRGTLEHETNLNELKAHYGELVWDEIALRMLWAESLSPASNYRPVYAYAPGSPAAAEAERMGQRVLSLAEATR